MDDRSIAKLASQQHGLVFAKQLNRELSEDRLRHRIKTGRLEIVRDEVYRVAGAPVTWRQELLAACMTAQHGAVASFRSAAQLWEIPIQEKDVLEITVPGRVRTRLPNVIVHDSQVLGASHLAELDGIPCTSAERTLCDLSGLIVAWRLEQLVDDAIRREIITLKKLQRVFNDLACRGRRRSTVIRTILEDRSYITHSGDSSMEVKLVLWLAKEGMPKPVQQHKVNLGIRTFKLDLAYPHAKIGIEYDGWDAHKGLYSFHHDRERDNLLKLAGWTMLRFTSRSSKQEIVSTIGKALEMVA